jgi:hypothetical protein
VFPGWCLFLLASRWLILLCNRSNFLGLKCVCTQKRLFLVNKKLLYQILPIHVNTCTWFDILAVQKCQLQCLQFGSARPAVWIVTCSARFNSVRSGSAWLSLQCEWGLSVCYTVDEESNHISVENWVHLVFRIESHASQLWSMGAQIFL